VSHESARPSIQEGRATIRALGQMEDFAHVSTEDDDDLDDPLLRALAAAPPISLGEAHLPPNTVVGQSYRLHRVIGAGAMGVVYEATDRVLSRRVAIKVHEIGRSDRAVRLWREARAMARLAHPNVVTVHEVGVDGSRGYIAMELVEGKDVRKWCTEAPRSWQEVLAVYRQAGEGLAAAHEVGIVHRDFKPDNVLIGNDGRVRVADFGLALEHEHIADAADDIWPTDFAVTRTGLIMGTPAYMSPEQARRQAVDARSDQFSFCVALWEALHGKRPVIEGMQLASTKARSTAPGIVPKWIDDVLRVGLAIDPAKRHADMSTLVRALDPTPRRRRRIAIALLAGALVGSGLLVRLGGALASPAEPCLDAGATIDATWSHQSASALRETFTERAPSIADVTAEILVPAFDGFATQWRAEARDACEATHVRGEQSETRLDQRMDCLERARLRFAAALDVVEAPDAMARAEVIAASLPDPRTCALPEAALDVEPSDPERRADFDELAAALDAVAAELAAGRVVQSKQALDDLVPRIETAGFRRMLGHARAFRGRTLLDLGRRHAAVDDLSAATSIAVQSGDRDAMASAMIGLAGAVGRTSAGFDEAMRWLENARALADELDWPVARRAELAQTELEILFYSERYDDAIALARQIIEDDPTDPLRIRALSVLAVSHERMTRWEDAIAAHDEALALVERVRGPDHPQTAMVLGNRVASLAALRRPDEVRASLDRALAIRLAVFGPHAPNVGEIYRQLGDMEVDAGNTKAAIAWFERALAVHRTAGDDAGEFFDLGNLSLALRDLGDMQRSAQLMEEQRVVGERAFGADSLRIAQLLINRALMRVEAGEYATAVSELERSLAIMTRELPPGDPTFAYVRGNLARAYAMVGRTDEALAQLQDARRIFDATLQPESPQRVEASKVIADILAIAGKPEESLRERREAVTLADRILPEHHPDRIAAWRQLGRHLVDLQREEAIEVLTRTKELAMTADLDAERIAEIDELLASARALKRR
jgi:tetratricopeptide (TPR) repeat protein/tRNA A-37 threonylcarbamoyl transferase component Bud32